MKHITFILTNGFLPDVRVYKEAKYLVEQGFSATILCWDRDTSKKLPKHEKMDGIEIIRFKIPSVYGTGMKQIGAYLKYIKKCSNYLKKHDTSYIHCNDVDGVIAGYISNRHRVPMVFDMHEFYENGSKFKRKLIRCVVIFFLKKSIAGLYENVAYLSEDYKSVREKLYPLRNYPDSSMVQYVPKTTSKMFRIAYHGMVRQYEEFVALFEATKDMEDVRIDINGGGVTVEALKKIQKRYKNVHINGPYNGVTDSIRLYSETDALYCGYDVSDPNYQGDAEVIKYYEAICTGTPMIMTAGIGMADKVKKFHFGEVCNTRNPKDIKKAVLKLKNNKEEWEFYHQNELKNADHYQWENAVKILSEIYK